MEQYASFGHKDIPRGERVAVEKFPRNVNNLDGTGYGLVKQKHHKCRGTNAVGVALDWYQSPKVHFREFSCVD